MAESQIPFVDLASVVGADPEIAGAVLEVVQSGRYVGGAAVEAFEQAWARYCGCGHAIGVGNGLDALTLILRAHDIGAGDEVIVPSWTFIATWLAVTRVGALVVPVEVDPDTGNIDPSLLSEALGPRVRAVICVHLYGQPANVSAIRDAIGARDVVLIEDAAQAHGATLAGARAGSLADAAAFSFYPSKNLGALGDGGAVTCVSSAIAARVRRLGNYGAETKYHHLEAGVNSRLDALQAAALLVRLHRLDAENARRREIASTYTAELVDLPWLALPRVIDGADPVWHLFVVRCAERDQLAAQLASAGIETGMHYPVATHRSGAYAGLGLDLPIADTLAQISLSLPIGPHLSGTDVARVIDAVRSFR